MNNDLRRRLEIVVDLLKAVHREEYAYVDQKLSVTFESFNVKFGLCRNIYEPFLKNYMWEHLKDNVTLQVWIYDKQQEWPSNLFEDPVFPVEGSMDEYFRNADKYEGARGKKRRELALYMAECIEKELLS